MLNEYEKLKYDTISKFVSKEITIQEVIKLLDLTECQIYRLKKVFIEQGEEGFRHKNRGKINLNKKDNNYTEEELKLIISEKYTRIIDNASSISYNKKYYIPINIETGETTCFMRGTKCTFIISYDGDFYGEIENHYYKMIELENRDSIMTRENENKEIKKEHHKYIPPINHPWRKNMMLRH